MITHSCCFVIANPFAIFINPNVFAAFYPIVQYAVPVNSALPLAQRLLGQHLTFAVVLKPVYLKPRGEALFPSKAAACIKSKINCIDTQSAKNSVGRFEHNLQKLLPQPFSFVFHFWLLI
jgi:hypothetical protein